MNAEQSHSSSAPAGEVTLASNQGRTVLSAVILGSAAASLTATVVSVALPVLAKAFDASSAEQTWIVNSFTLTLAALILLGGSLGDRYGRAKVYRIGIAWFAIASVACALAWDVPSLIVFRLLQGVGGALLVPGSLAIIEATFRKSDRGTGVGLWSGISGIANALGPLIGGLLVTLSWRWAFWINVPVAALAFVLALTIPESRNEDDADKPIDTTGAVLGTLWLGAISYALIAGPDVGWTPIIISAAVVGVVGLVLFGINESRVSNPMLPLKLFSYRTFSVAVLLTFTIYGAMGVVFFLLPLQLQVVSGWSPVQAGAAMLPITVLMFFGSPRFSTLASQRGPRLFLTVGPLIMAIGVLMFRRIGPDASFLVDVLPELIVFGFGLSMLVAPITSTTLEAVPENFSGAASGVSNAVSRTGGLIAVAAIPSLVGLTGGALSNADKLNPGFDTAMIVSAIMVALSGVAAALLLKPNAGHAQPAATDGASDSDAAGGGASGGDKGRKAESAHAKHHIHRCPTDGQLT